MKWFRVYHDMPHDPKLRRIAHQAGATLPHTLSVWLYMLCHASQNEGSARGTLAGWSDDDCAFALGMDRAIVFAIRGQMEARTLDGNRIISWSKRQQQSDNATSRWKTWDEKRRSERQQKQEVSSEPTLAKRLTNDGPTLDQRLRGEEKREIIEEANASSHPKPRRRASMAGPDFEIFWSLYPRKVGKGAAERVWLRAVAQAGGADEIVFALRQQLDGRHPTVAPKNGAEFIPHPATYLNQRRWLDGAQSEIAA